MATQLMSDMSQKQSATLFLTQENKKHCFVFSARANIILKFNLSSQLHSSN
ncbi:hypothetical protein [Acinetobacter thermotolerans]|uniref:hypothetical protein n=1 Tax=Acinetobacter thermotolerans TaxID=3151487 RepID=UPI00325C2A7A